MEIMGLDAGKRLNYAYWKIPYKSLEAGRTAPAFNPPRVTRLPAYIIGGNHRLNGRNLSLEKLRELFLQNSLNTRYLNKYKNTIGFIEACENKSSSS